MRINHVQFYHIKRRYSTESGTLRQKTAIFGKIPNPSPRTGSKMVA